MMREQQRKATDHRKNNATRFGNGVDHEVQAVVCKRRYSLPIVVCKCNAVRTRVDRRHAELRQERTVARIIKRTDFNGKGPIREQECCWSIYCQVRVGYKSSIWNLEGKAVFRQIPVWTSRNQFRYSDQRIGAKPQWTQ